MPNPDIMRAVERLDYRVTTGDVAAQAGLDVNIAQQGLLALAADAGGHLQVAESGEIVYLFPKNFRAILRNKYLRLRLQEWWGAIWKVLFYLIRISFGVVLIVSIFIIIAAIVIILIALNSSRGDSDDQGQDDGGGVSLPNIWFSPDFVWFFHPGYYDRQYQLRQLEPDQPPKMNFLEAVFSFLFGDGNPNFDLESRRWQEIGAVIRNNRGAVAAEQVAPYLDDLGHGYARDYEEYMLPILTRFNGRPEVSPVGDIVYHFPDLQVTVSEREYHPVPAYLKEFPWRFSRAGSGQLLLALGLGVVNFVGALALGKLLADGSVAAELGGFIAFVQSIYWGLLGYGAAFLLIPFCRYFWVQWCNRRITARNEDRQERAMLVNQADEQLQAKLNYAQEFAATTVIRQDDLIYTTERELVEQEIERSAEIDAEWNERLQERQRDE